MINKRINNISKVLLVVGIFFLISSTLTINKPKVYDNDFELEEAWNDIITIDILVGETLRIELINFSGNVSITLQIQMVRDLISSNMTKDGTFEIPVNYSGKIGVIINANQYSIGHLKVYTSGLSAILSFEISLGVLAIGLGSLIEVIWRRKVSDIYLIDEEKSVNFRMLVVGLFITFLFSMDVNLRENRYVSGGSQGYYYSWKVHLYSALNSILFNVAFILIIFLFISQFRRMVFKSQTKVYLSYPVDPLHQYSRRILVQAAIYLPIVFYLVVASLFTRGSDFGGIFYILPVYLPVFILTFTTVICFLLIQILITDVISKPVLNIILLPVSIFITPSLFPKNPPPPFGLLFLLEDNINPPLGLHVLYLVGVCAITVYLNIRLRKSNRFMPN